jgi:hypothetical protein
VSLRNIGILPQHSTVPLPRRPLLECFDEVNTCRCTRNNYALSGTVKAKHLSEVCDIACRSIHWFCHLAIEIVIDFAKLNDKHVARIGEIRNAHKS